MAIDWKSEIDLTKRIFLWYMRVGLISVPFGLVYACACLRLGHESTAALVITLAATFLTVWKINGMPPDK